jgi:uncharacterized Zn finger protein
MKRKLILPLTRLLSREVLMAAAGRASERGEDILKWGRARLLSESGTRVTATVLGGSRDEAEICTESQGIEYHCSCPAHRRNPSCRHCVATPLLWLRRREEGRSFLTPLLHCTIANDDLRSLLRTKLKSDLIELILAAAEADPALRLDLTRQAARRKAAPLDLEPYREGIEDSLHFNGLFDFLEYTGGMTPGVETMLHRVEQLLAEGFAAEVAELAEFAVSAVENEARYLRDPSREVSQVLHELVLLHHRACQAAEFAPDELARLRQILAQIG